MIWLLQDVIASVQHLVRWDPSNFISSADQIPTFEPKNNKIKLGVYVVFASSVRMLPAYYTWHTRAPQASKQRRGPAPGVVSWNS